LASLEQHLSVIGCSSTTIHVAKIQDRDTQGQTSKESIAILREGEDISKPYDVLGTIFVNSAEKSIYGKIEEREVVDIAKEQAANMGANAIIRVHSEPTFDKYPKMQKYVNGIAVKFSNNPRFALYFCNSLKMLTFVLTNLLPSSPQLIAF
jgi:hypothetical protein